MPRLAERLRIKPECLRLLLVLPLPALLWEAVRGGWVLLLPALLVVTWLLAAAWVTLLVAGLVSPLEMEQAARCWPPAVIPTNYPE